MLVCGRHELPRAREHREDGATHDLLPGVRRRGRPPHRVRARLAGAVDQLAASAALLRRPRVPGRRAGHARLWPLRASTRATRTMRWSTACRTCSSCWTRWAGRRRSGSATTGEARWSGAWPAIIPSDASAWPTSACRISPTGFAPETLIPLVDRAVYPEAQYPAGQWDYQLFYEESFDKARAAFEANVRQYRQGPVQEGRARAARASRPAPRRSATTAAGSAEPARRPTCRGTPTC